MAIVRDSGFPPGRLTLEVTEQVLLSDVHAAAKTLGQLSDEGIRVALDDFGAGFTSLRHLQALGIDTVKIDGSFVRNLADRPDNQNFLRHVLGLLRELGLKTVAECVETEEEAAMLRRQGVDFLQGYYFGKPTIVRAWPEGPVSRVRPNLSSAAC
jgi:EAL domain-containing protein (putative c-di-GMP-specific phosphodiesterase class I)